MTDSEGIEKVLERTEDFRKKLGIGKITNQSLQRKLADEFVGILDAYSTGKSVIDLIIRILPILGIGAGAPAAGWVIVACFVAAASYFGMNRYLRSGENDNGDPLDPLAVALFHFLAPLGLRVAALDRAVMKSELQTGGRPVEVPLVAALDRAVTKSERQCIENYFAREWGYSRKFVRKELPKLECNVETFPIVEVVDNLIEFAKRSPGCNYKALSKELTDFLQKVTRADGELDDLEVIFIQWLEIKLAKGKPGFFDRLRSAVGVSQRPGQQATGEIGPPPDLDSDGEALRGGRTGDGSSGQDGQQTSTMVGRAYRSTLHWLTT